MKDYILNVFFKTAIKYNISISDFWGLTPVTLGICVQAKVEKIKEDVKFQDGFNWQLGQYIQMAVGSCLDKKCKYPEKPLFSKFKEERNEKVLTEKQQETERMKALNYFSNLGSFVAIKK